MPYLRPHILPIAEFRLPRLQVELPAAGVTRVIANGKPLSAILRRANPVNPKEEDHEQTT